MRFSIIVLVLFNVNIRPQNEFKLQFLYVTLKVLIFFYYLYP